MYLLKVSFCDKLEAFSDWGLHPTPLQLDIKSISNFEIEIKNT